MCKSSAPEIAIGCLLNAKILTFLLIRLASIFFVIEDTDANEGIVITCNRFTSDAAKYAKSKGIKLAVLRLFETKDMVGRFHKVGVTFHVLSAAKPSVQLFISEDDGALFHKQIKEIGVQAEISLRDQVFIVEEGQKFRYQQLCVRPGKEGYQFTTDGGSAYTHIHSG